MVAPPPLLRIKLVTSRSLEMNGGDGAKERKLKDARERQIDDGVEIKKDKQDFKIGSCVQALQDEIYKSGWRTIRLC